jgi:hypothetical protein
MEVKGFIKEIGTTGEFGKSNFKKRQLLVTEDVEKYPQTLPIDFVQDKCSLLDSFSVGDKVEVSVNLRSNEYNGKFYVSIQGWKISKTEPLGPTVAVINNNPEIAIRPATPEQAFEPADDLNEDLDIPF